VAACRDWGPGSGKLSPGPARLPVPLLLHLVSHCIVNSLLIVARRLLWMEMGAEAWRRG
jgi:hypothetical protein